MLSLVSRRAWQTTRGLLRRRLPAEHFTRQLCATSNGAGNGNEKPPDDNDDQDQEDEFGLEGFEIDIDEEEDLEPQLKQIADEGKDVAPELASELVAKMVESATKSLADTSPAKGAILSAISPHTISVLKASRITTNAVQSAASDLLIYPITRKVHVKLSISDLNMSQPAVEALQIIAGPRVHGEEIWFSSQKYPSLEENRADAISKLDRLVAAAKVSVGETVDNTPLHDWQQIVAQVEMQAAEEVAEAGSVATLTGG